MNKIKPAVFLDRDGTLIEEVGYLKEPKDLKLFEGTSAAIKKLNEHKILAILITNQSGVARGYFDEDNVKMLNQKLIDILNKEKANIDAAYYCPHHTKGIIEKYSIKCDCRKPKAGMIEQALKDFEEIDISKSYVIGDKACDIELARNAGCKGILLKTGYGAEVIKDQESVEPDYIAEDIEDAVDWLLKDLKTA